MSQCPTNILSVPDPDIHILSESDDLNKFILPVSCKKNLLIFHVNIRSIRANFDNFQAFISKHLDNISVIILSEIWIFDNETCFYGFDEFDSFFCCRNDNRSGGIAVFTRSNLKFSQLDIAFISAEVLLLQCKSLNLTLFSIYRSHDFTIDFFNSELKNALSLLNLPNIILMGDININILNNDCYVMEYLNIMSQHGFFSHLNQPTRSVLSSSTCIDHVFVKTSKFSIQTAILLTDLSDHFPTICKIIYSDETPELAAKPDCTLKLNFSLFCDYLTTYKFNENFNLSLDQQYQLLAFQLNNIKNNFKYPKFNRIKAKNQWLTHEIMVLMKRKEKLFKKVKKYPFDIVYKTAYKTTVSELKRIIKFTKTQFYKRKFEDCNSCKQKWNFVSRVVNNECKSPVLPTSSDNFALASQFNSLFINVNHVPTNCDFIKCKQYITPCASSFVLLEVTDFEVFDVLNSFSKVNSFDFDGICLKFLKLIASNNIDFLCHFINASFFDGVFPNSLKQATVTPIYKSGDKNILSNYRPISILPSFSKIIEKIISKRMFKFLYHTNFFSTNQYGFLEGRSTEMVLLEFSKFIYNSIDNNQHTVAIFLDIKKAFDNVNHSLLIFKLENAGFRGPILKWLNSYLSNRTQRVKVGDCLSEFCVTNCGVPQGSILGPLFFLIYINDFCKLDIYGKMLTFADDTVLLYSNSDLNTLLQQINSDLIKIEKWFVSNYLTLNLNKTKYIHFNLRNTDLNLNLKYHTSSCYNNTDNSCNCHTLQSVKSIKYLGLYIDHNLKWKTHINELSKKLRFVLFKLSHLKNKLSSSFLKTLYFAWFFPLLNYGAIVWGGEYKTNLQPLISIQNKCFNILNHNNLQNYPLFRNLNLLPIRHNAYYRIILYLYRNRSICPPPVNSYITRSNDTFQVPKFSKDIFTKHFFYLAPKLYNKLPVSLTSINRYSTFKRNLFNFLINIDDLDLFFTSYRSNY